MSKADQLIEVLDSDPWHRFSGAELEQITGIRAKSVNALLHYPALTKRCLKHAPVHGRASYQSILSGSLAAESEADAEVVQIIVPACQAKPLRPRGPRFVFELGVGV